MSIVQNSRAIEGALQRLQGPAARGKLLVKATGPDTLLYRGAVLAPVDGGQVERRGSVFVRPNPATQTDAAEEAGAWGAWTVTAAGVLVDVEALQGGLHGNRDGGLTYCFDPAVEGVELEAIAEASGITGGSWLDAHGALRQFSHVKALNRVPNISLFQSNTFDFPAAILGWAQCSPLDGGQASRPGPRTNRVGRGKALYRHTWFLWLCTTRLEDDRDRTIEAQVLLSNVLEVLQDTQGIRERALLVSASPGAMIVSAAPHATEPTCYIDQVTIETVFTLEHRPEDQTFNPWLRTRHKNLTAPGAPPANDPPLELPNQIIPMPPDGPGTPPFP